MTGLTLGLGLSLGGRGGGVPANVLMLNGQPLTLNGAYLTLN